LAQALFRGDRPRSGCFTEARIERLRAAGYQRAFLPLELGVRDYVQTYLAAGDPYR
jgi:ADP-L-glycero-D-manno-heptose 6-epimerase